MKTTICLSLVLLLYILPVSCTAQSPETGIELKTETLLEYQRFITEDLISDHLSVIAHDSLAGREAGMPGERKAAEYLANYYSELELEPVGEEGFFQPFILNAEQTDSLVYSISSVVAGDTLLTGHSVTATGREASFLRLAGGSVPVSANVVFAGFGVLDTARGVDHLSGVDLSNKWVMVFDEIPHVVDGDTMIDPAADQAARLGEILLNNKAAGLIIISDQPQERFEERSAIVSALVNKPRNVRLAYLNQQGPVTGMREVLLEAAPGIAAELLGLNSAEELQELKQQIINDITGFEASESGFILDYRPYEGTRELRSKNVAAFLKGGDPELSEEVVVLMGHYDHIGIVEPDESGDMISNGADDNGSGTAGLMAIAGALSEAAGDGIRPNRSVLFLHVSAEESGLLGSRYYSDHPLISIENTVANFNADMISRSDNRNIEMGDTDYVYIIGGDIISSELDSLVHSANSASVNMRLDYTYNDLQDPNQFYRRSDHWNFGRFGVPFVFFFAGVHDDYHRPSDETENQDIPKLTRITKLIYTSTLKVANYDGKPVVDNQEFINITRDLPR